MLLLSSTSVLRVISGSAGALDAHVSSMDVVTATGVVTPNPPTNTASIVTATTTTICASPSSGHIANVKNASIANTHATVSNAISVEHYDGTTAETLWDGTLLAGENVIMDESGQWTKYSSNGQPQTVGLPVTTKGDLLVFDTNPNRLAVGADMQVLTAAASAASGLKWAAPLLTNRSVSTVSAGYAADTYLAGSSIAMPAGGPVVGTVYKCVFDMVKTGAGVAAATVIVRYGTAGTTSDAAILTFTWGAGTAAADNGFFEVFAHFRTVGSGTSAVMVGLNRINKTVVGVTGLVSNTTGQLWFLPAVVSSGFNSTPAGSILGVSFNGGASFSGTNTIVQAEAFNLSI
jgi:hypothetical protein